MSLLSRLQPKLGRFAVPNLTVILIVGQLFLYIANEVLPQQADTSILERIQFLPAEIFSGEVWRLLTFLFNPPTTNFVFALLFWYLFFVMGTTLEANWGAFRFNAFLLIGYLASVVAAFTIYFTTGINLPATNGFLYGTIFLAFARLHPDYVLYLMFVLPVKIKWLAMMQWILYGFELANGNAMTRGMIVASVANFFIFFGAEIWDNLKNGRRRMKFQTRTMRPNNRLIHKCVICGLTSEASPQAQFRYCSKCDGELCYCPEHLQNHEHRSKVGGAT